PARLGLHLSRQQVIGVLSLIDNLDAFVGEQLEHVVDSVGGQITAIESCRQLGHGDRSALARVSDDVGYLLKGGRSRDAHADQSATGSALGADTILSPRGQ